MHSRPRKILAMVLCCQPVLWMSNVALAQSLQQLSGYGSDKGGASTPRLRTPSLGALSATEANEPRYDESAGPALGDPLRPRPRRDAGAVDPSLVPLPPVDQPIDPASYVLGPGDKLEVNLWGLQNLRLPVNVDLEGRVFIPKIGYLELKGQTLSEARRALREAVARYYPGLGFEVGLLQPRTFLVQAVGAVINPGSYPAQATERISTFLLQSGRLAPNASKRRIEIRRRGGAVLVVDLETFHLTGDVQSNPFLQDGDVVMVPYASVTAKAEGAVNRPGEYELIGRKDLAELFQLAGGLSPGSTRLLPLSIVRRGPNDAQALIPVPFPEGDRFPAFQLQLGDAVRVAAFDEVQRSVMVIGALAGVSKLEEAASTRRLGFVEGDTVRTLLARVGGVGPLASLDESYLLRGDTSIPVDLKALVMLKDLSADRPVQLGDALVIPFKRSSILVEGAVFNPGLYPYNPRFGVEQYLALAGGRNRFALELADARIVNSSGMTLPYTQDLKVEPGSSLVIPERNFSRSELVQISIAVAGVLISGAALFISIQTLKK